MIDVVSRDGGIERLTAYHADASLRGLVDELRLFPPLPDGDHPAAIAIRSGTSRVAEDMPTQFLASTTQDARHYDVTRELQFTSYVTAPLLSNDRPIGALTVVSAGSGRHFGGAELRLVEELATQVASVIERERRFDEQHRISLMLQRSMLPADLESPEGFTVCARYFASGEETEVGGDFYDVVRLDDSNVALVIGDVQGHDLVAITAMAKVRSALRAFLQSMRDPGAVLRATDRFVADQTERRFVTLALALVDVASGELQLALAGHPAPLLVGETIEALACRPGPPAGTVHHRGHPRYENFRYNLPTGAGLLFYTDGLVETRSGGPDARLPLLFGALERHRTEPLEAACNAVIEETLSGSSPMDDVALLWAARDPVELPSS